MSWDNNVYYNPKSLGLTHVGMLNDPEASYSFNDLVVWQHEDGRLFYASDSGCSCPSPFEDYNSIESLTEIADTDDFNTFCSAVDSHCRWEWMGEESESFTADKVQLKAKVAELLRNR